MKIRLLTIAALAAVVLSACASIGEPPTATPTAAATATPPVGGSSSPVLACYYVWTTQELQDLSATFQDSLKNAISPDAIGSAYAYGEDCVAADGTRRFSAMETDFRVRLPVDNLTDQQRMGDFMAAALRLIGAIPREKLVGPQPGRVDFEFDAADGSNLHVNVELDRLQSEAASLSGAALFKHFYQSP